MKSLMILMMTTMKQMMRITNEDDENYDYEDEDDNYDYDEDDYEYEDDYA